MSRREGVYAGVEDRVADEDRAQARESRQPPLAGR
jgi:hypothetical protein